MATFSGAAATLEEELQFYKLEIHINVSFLSK